MRLSRECYYKRSTDVITRSSRKKRYPFEDTYAQRCPHEIPPPQAQHASLPQSAQVQSASRESRVASLRTANSLYLDEQSFINVSTINLHQPGAKGVEHVCENRSQTLLAVLGDDCRSQT